MYWLDVLPTAVAESEQIIEICGLLAIDFSLHLRRWRQKIRHLKWCGLWCTFHLARVHSLYLLQSPLTAHVSTSRNQTAYPTGWCGESWIGAQEEISLCTCIGTHIDARGWRWQEEKNHTLCDGNVSGISTSRVVITGFLVSFSWGWRVALHR